MNKKTHFLHFSIIFYIWPFVVFNRFNLFWREIHHKKILFNQCRHILHGGVEWNVIFLSYFNTHLIITSLIKLKFHRQSVFCHLFCSIFSTSSIVCLRLSEVIFFFAHSSSRIRVKSFLFRSWNVDLDRVKSIFGIPLCTDFEWFALDFCAFYIINANIYWNKTINAWRLQKIKRNGISVSYFISRFRPNGILNSITIMTY